ncbi:mRNA-capping enzyme [Diorhabda sublineata]|uniref:mRNA-capping enzyme n=1 Tax=Diorhabda sublineata TaxID=1163346 RepID=UPI0024E0E8E3|nr:mRNA-capping enzyme [Diorhabda sublineata]
MSKSKNPGPVPPRWLRCPRKSEHLIIGKFMAFKTPLSSDFDDQVPLEHRFPPKMLFKTAKRNKIKLGLWIDLTNTSRFYDKSEIEEHDCEYLKLRCRGHGAAPSKTQADTFIKIVHNYISQHPLQSIAVHCTHGFNRTGFLIVSYLVQMLDYSLEKALDLFAEARPEGIYKHYYIKELYRRFDDIDDAPNTVALPDWCIEDDTKDSDSEDHNGEIASTSLKQFSDPPTNNQPENRPGKSNNPKFMEGVPGVEYVQDQKKRSSLKKKVQTMCKWTSKSFSGSQPVSMNVVNIKLLQKNPYRVSWKADGMRYMMLIDGEEEIYFFDRDNNVFKVNGLRFVNKKDVRVHLKDTLLDGEMVIDKVNGQNIPRYLVYDIVQFQSCQIGDQFFYPDRIKCLENEIFKPRQFAMEKGFINRSSEPFSVRKKDFWPITQAASLLGEKFAKTLSHEPDGLIFQPSKEPYTAGRCDTVLKWKPLTLNSVDFRMKIHRVEGTGIVSTKKCLLFVSNRKDVFAEMKYTNKLKDLDDKIIECKFENKEWKFMRERTDKSFANSWETAIAVCDSIINPVTKENLLEFIQKFGFKDDSEMMPPPRKMVKR